VSRRPPLDTEELWASVVLLGSIPFSIGLMGVLFGTVSSGSTFALLVPFIPPFAAALAVGEKAFPLELRNRIVAAALVATFASVAAYYAGQVLLAEPPRSEAGLAGVVALAVYVAGSVFVVRDRLQDERLWPAVGAVASAVFWLVAAVLG
jgi:hypothetical protein